MMKRRILAILTMLSLCLTLLPSSTFAAAGGECLHPWFSSEPFYLNYRNEPLYTNFNPEKQHVKFNVCGVCSTVIPSSAVVEEHTWDYSGQGCTKCMWSTGWDPRPVCDAATGKINITFPSNYIRSENCTFTIYTTTKIDGVTPLKFYDSYHTRNRIVYPIQTFTEKPVENPSSSSDWNPEKYSATVQCSDYKWMTKYRNSLCTILEPDYLYDIRVENANPIYHNIYVHNQLASGSTWPTVSSGSSGTEKYQPPEVQTMQCEEDTDFTVEPWSIPGMVVTPSQINGHMYESDIDVYFTYAASDKGAIDLKEAKLIGGKAEGADYTEEEARRLGLWWNGRTLIKGKEYTQTVSEETDKGGQKWWIVENEPVKGKTKGEKITYRVKKATNKYNVTVHYYYPGRAIPAAPTKVQSYEDGTVFTIDSPKIDGYTPDAKYVHGKIEGADQEFTVTYNSTIITADAQHYVTVDYVVENKQDDTTTKAPPRVRQFKRPNEKYSIESPKLEGYLPDIQAVSGTMGYENVNVLVTYKPKYTLTIIYQFPDGRINVFTEELPDGAKYSRDSSAAVSEFYRTFSDTDPTNAWEPSPEKVEGTIEGADVTVGVTYTCGHPRSHKKYVKDDDEHHHVFCSLCNSAVADTTEEHTLGNSYSVSVSELPDNLKDDPAYQNGGMRRDCTKGCGHYEIISADEDRCPEMSDGKHVWSKWENVNDNDCERTCAACHAVQTAPHAWKDWTYASSKTHYRVCSHCAATETGNHGSWSGVTQNTAKDCTESAHVTAHCGICNQDVPAVHSSILGSLPDGHQYIAEGHKFDGGLVRLGDMHTQKCSVCGAFDIEHKEEHSWGEGEKSQTGKCGEGEIVTTYTCQCGATRTETEPWVHNWVRDTSLDEFATCLTAGKIGWKCTICGETMTDEVEAFGHEWEEDEGNHEATCEEEGVMSFHCTHEGCMATYVEYQEKKSPTGQHHYVDNVTSQPTCTRPGYYSGYVCEYCGDVNESGKGTHYGEIPKLGHDLDTSKTQVVRRRSYVDKEGNLINEEVMYATHKCKRCGYEAPKSVFTVGTSNKISRYRIEPGVATKQLDVANGIKITGQMGKDNAIYFQQEVNKAVNNIIQLDRSIYSQAEGSVITYFDQEFLDTLEDGNYEVIHLNGDEATALTIVIENHEIVDVLDHVAELDEETDENEPIEYGEALYYLSEAGDNYMFGENSTLFGGADKAKPSVEAVKAEFDLNDEADIVVIKYDKGNTFDGEHPVKLFGEDVPATEEIPSETEGGEPTTRTNYTINNDKIILTKEYLASLGAGKHEFSFCYTDAESALMSINIFTSASVSDAQAVKKDGGIEVTASLGGDEVQGRVIAALYDEDNTLVAITSTEADSSKAVTLNFDTQNGKTVKLFWWDELDTMHPSSDAATINISEVG